MNTSLSVSLGFCLAFISINPIQAQDKSRFDFKRIEDNSFLIEESYNQEPGVIQHISAFQYMKNKTWVYTFTDEWPVPGRTHQLSTSIPILNNGGSSGFGDLALNYRYQAVLTDRLAFSPRFSFILPTGDYRRNLGNGALGYQVNFPVSRILSRKFVTHYNLGSTYIPGAKTTDTSKSDILNINYGGSVIYLASETFNFMFEVAGYSNTVRTKEAGTTTTYVLFINPGVRFALNFKSGLQIVPGISVPVGVGHYSKGEKGLFLYLSFEHPLWKAE